MKKIRFNIRFLATEGVPEIVTVGMIPFTMLALFCGWVHGGFEITLCAIVFMLCTWSTCYREYQEVQDRISKLHFGLFCISFLFTMALGAKLYAMTDTTSTRKLMAMMIFMMPCLMINVGYNSAIRRAEQFEDIDRERRIALAGYKALLTVAIIVLSYSVCFMTVYYWGDTLSALFGFTKIELWQMTFHNMLNK